MQRSRLCALVVNLARKIVRSWLQVSVLHVQHVTKEPCLCTARSLFTPVFGHDTRHLSFFAVVKGYDDALNLSGQGLDRILGTKCAYSPFSHRTVSLHSAGSGRPDGDRVVLQMISLR